MMSVSVEMIFTLACIIILVWRNEEKFTETTGRESDRAELTDWSACKLTSVNSDESLKLQVRVVSASFRPSLCDVTTKDRFLNRFFFNFSNALDNRVTSVGFPLLDTVLPRVHVIFSTTKVHLLLKDMIDGSKSALRTSHEVKPSIIPYSITWPVDNCLQMTEPLLLTLNFNLPAQDVTGLRRLLRKKKLKRKVTVNLINALTPIVVELLFPAK